MSMFQRDNDAEDKNKANDWNTNNMTRKHTPTSFESDSYVSAAGRNNKHQHRRIPRQKKDVVEYDDYDNGDDANASDSEYETDQEEEAKNDAISESLSNVPETETTYVKVAPLPIFRGTPSESPVTHLSRFNKVCRANNASSIEMQKKIFPVTLEEEAALWYDLNIEPYYFSLSWDDIKLSFLQAYYAIEPVEELRSELLGIHQGEKESVRSYFLRLQWILKRWPEHGLDDYVIKGVFLDGLREEFRDWVIMHKPNSLNDALKLAFAFEQVRNNRGKRGIVRSFSMGESSSQRNVGTNYESEKGGKATMGKKQCQCTKHQCSKKTLSRNSSGLDLSS